MRVGIASDHGGFVLKGQIAESLAALPAIDVAWQKSRRWNIRNPKA